jgi:TPR repeat protein
LLQAVRALGSQHPHLLLFASGVQSHEEFEVCRRLRMQGFTGPFASHRRDWTSKTMDPGTARLCNLVTSLRGGAEMDRIIRDIQRDPLLSYRVLAYANSAGIGAQRKVQTLKDAILLIGHEPLFRWLVLLLCASGPSPQEDSAVLENALVRGRMMELLARQIAGAPAEDCFLTGVLSLLDVMLQQPASALFAALDLPDAVKAALLDGASPCAALLRLVQACEQQSGDCIQALCAELAITPQQLSLAQAEALEWARGQSPDAAGEASFALQPSAPVLQAPAPPIAAKAPVLAEAPALAEPPKAASAVSDAPPGAPKALLDAAQRGEPQAQCALGACYATGDGVPQDSAQALAWYTLAAQQGHANAQWNAAVLHAHAQGGTGQDEQQAFAWCQQAAAQGFAPAQATLGLMYSTGQGAAKDLGKALVLLEQAALQGDVEAQYNLAVLQEQELQGETGLKQALAWFAKAAEQGLPAAQDRLGRMYAMGQTREPDLVEACKWFLIASQAHNAQAQANLAYSRTLMQTDQVQEAEHHARRWMQVHAAARGLQAAASGA